MVFFFGGEGGALFCGFKILAILQNLLPFCFVEFTLEKKKKEEKIYKTIRSFFMSPKGQNLPPKKQCLLFHNTIVAKKKLKNINK